jgi:beta-phosphoglucomutase-like phosphatase (HAD superfamily)
VLAAARSLGVRPERCLLIGDIGADVAAAAGAGAQAILVPTPATRPEEVAAADLLAPDLPAAVRSILTGAVPASRGGCR